MDSAFQALGTAGVAARPKLDRRLAAVLIADVAGYARLMERDETGTHVRLQCLRTEVIEPALVSHGGRITRSTGDGLLVTFASATGALRCAVEMQRELARRNAHVPQADQIRFRMGLNVGDILFDEHDIAGVSVNVAARLEALAKPGEICISRALKDQVQEAIDVKYLDAGSRRVKNISRPVRVYRVLAVPPTPLAALQATLVMSVGACARWIAAAAGVAAIAALAAALPGRASQLDDAVAAVHNAVQAQSHVSFLHVTPAQRRLM
ncbi:MAG TPA: adenylate/guanylate cyclase domain-containing protein [Burkholderiaceae bacterium]|nr:adenylate/guanylate cyclase domain-containing protein [Burkholderiaceae bacterium]